MTDRVGRVCSSHGIKILWETVPHSRTVSLGFFFPSGSQDDPIGKNGTAHFVEHMLFKGTKSHSAGSLAQAVDRLGGELNAYTDREEMAFHCTVPAQHWQAAADILFELCFEPVFPAEEIEKERSVIRSEILSALEDPEDRSFEAFYHFSYQGSSYGQPVAGTFESLDQIQRTDLIQWAKSHLIQSNLHITICGPLELGEILSWTESKSFPRSEMVKNAPHQFGVTSFVKSVKQKIQTAQIIGSFHFPTPQGLGEALSLQWFSLLWGETMSSRLFQNIRENRGLCYSISSQVSEELHIPVLHFFASCAPENTLELVHSLKAEVDRLKMIPSEEEWESAKLALLGGVLLGSERMENRMQRLIQSYWSLGQLYSLDHLEFAIKELSVNTAWAYLSPHLRKPSLLVWGAWKKNLGLDRIWS